MSAVTAVGLTFEYRNTRTRAPGREAALQPLDLEIRSGQVVGLLGPNGAGKSTLLGLLATALRPTAGRLVILGEDAARPAALRRRLGYAGDTAIHYDALSGRANACFFGRAAGLGPREAGARAARWLTRFGLAEDASRPVAEYSFGMRRRLLLAEAVLHEPELVLLDEPTVGLDPEGRNTLRGVLRERADRGGTAVLATNDVAEAQIVCDRVVFLHEGRRVGGGTPERLLAGVAGTRVEVGIRSAAPPAIALDRGAVVEATPERLVVRSEDGAAILPELCDAVLRTGAEIRSIRLRDPDLAEVFRTLTGTALQRGEDAA